MEKIEVIDIRIMIIKKVKVKFYGQARNSLPSLNYRPHFMVNGDSEPLGIEFLDLKLKEFDVFTEAAVKLLYENVGYHKLTEGVCFNIIEGATIVGEGYVLE